jgi:hypothetical protein
MMFGNDGLALGVLLLCPVECRGCLLDAYPAAATVGLTAVPCRFIACQYKSPRD